MPYWAEWILLFTIYSLLGWICESTYCSILAKKFVNRGFLNGPFCPIYGVGALLIVKLLSPFSDNLVILFSASHQPFGIPHRLCNGKTFPCQMVGLFPPPF